MSENLTKSEWARKVCNYTEKQCEMVVVAYEDGHAVGKVEGFEETLDAVERELSKIIPQRGMWQDVKRVLEALRKQPSQESV